MHAVYIAMDTQRPQCKRAPIITADCTAITSALHGLTSQTCLLRAESAAAGGATGQVAVRPPLLVYVAGVHGDVLEACSAQLAATAVPHCMMAW